MSALTFLSLLLSTSALANPVCPFGDTLIGEGTFVGDTTNETDDFLGSCGGGRAPDVEVAFEAVLGGTYRFETISGISDTVLSALDNDCSTVIGCDDDGGGGLRSLLYVDLEPAETILLVIDGFDGNDVGSVTLTAELAVCGDGVVDPGESCDDGNNIFGDGCDSDCFESLLSCPVGGELVEGVAFAGETVPGSTDTLSLCASASSVTAGVELSFVAETTGTYRMTTEDAGVGSTLLSVFADDCVTELACDNSAGPGVASTVYVDLVANQVAKVVVDGSDLNDVGGFSLLADLAVCGDGVVDPGETCDDGNPVDGDGCDLDCTRTAFTLAATSLVPNESMTLSTEHALPGADVFFLVSGSVDPANPTCRGGLCSDLTNPIQLGRVVADAQGTASLTVQAPGVAPPVVFSQAVWFSGGTGDVSNLLEITNFGPRQCLDFDDQQWRYFSSANHTLAASGTQELEFTPDQVTGISAAVMSTAAFAPPYRISLQYSIFDDDGNVRDTNAADGIALFLGKDPTSYDTTPPPTGGTRGVIDDGDGVTVEVISFGTRGFAIRDGLGDNLGFVEDGRAYTDGAFRELVAEVYEDRMRVFFEGELLLEEAIDLTGAFETIGLSAATGGSDSQHVVRDFCIQSMP